MAEGAWSACVPAKWMPMCQYKSRVAVLRLSVRGGGGCGMRVRGYFTYRLQLRVHGTSHFSYRSARSSSDPTLQPRGAPRHGVRPPASGCARQPQLRGIRLRAACALPLPYCRRPGRACGATRACWARANRCAFLSAARRALTCARRGVNLLVCAARCSPLPGDDLPN